MTVSPQAETNHTQKSRISTASIPAVVLAGGKAKPELEAVIGLKVRALAEVNGKSLLSHIVDAMRGASELGDITVVGDVPDSDQYGRVPDGGDFVTNIFGGLERCLGAPFALVSTSDLPFIKSDTIDRFVYEAIHLAEASGANMVYPIVEAAVCYKQFPGIKRTARKLKEGAFTGGNMVLLRPEFMLQHRQRIADAYAARKSPARLAAMLGFGTLLRLVLSQTISPGLLSVSLLETRASAMLGGAVKSLAVPDADIATDLDKPEDFLALRK